MFLRACSQVLQDHIHRLVQQHPGDIELRHFDGGVVSALKQLGDDEGIEALDELTGNDFRAVSALCLG